MLDGLCLLLRAQNFAGLAVESQYPGIYAINAREGAPKPHIVISRTGGNGNPTISEPDDDDLVDTDVDVFVRDTNGIRASGIADVVRKFINDCWPSVITCAGGNREIAFVQCTEPNDQGQAPQDGGDNWDIGSRFTATIQHTPA